MNKESQMRWLQFFLDKSIIENVKKVLEEDEEVLQNKALCERAKRKLLPKNQYLKLLLW